LLSAPSKKPYEFAAWLIDLDGTLYYQMPVRLMMGIELLVSGRRSVGLLREFRREHELLHGEKLPDGAEPFAMQLQRAAEKCGIDLDVAARIVDEWMIARPGKWLRQFLRRSLIERICRFRSLGGRTAIVSDYPARRKLAAMGLEQQFDVVVAAGESPGPCQLKPSPAGMFLAAGQLEVASSECLVIGDRWDADGIAAHSAGMQFQHVASRWPS